ncbi:rhodanese-related sulfurtransferase [Labrys okinawensis]|uniref:oxygen-dependent tRNA uridine(34) hydroxylase TrhO n=1 Tax=Labrys okinawensis TaxID=346911 RepID=UPI0039BD3E1F
MQPIEIAAFYHFARLPDSAALREPLAKLTCSLGIKGIILLAPEGINGTVGGSPEAMAAFHPRLREITGLTAIEHKTSFADEMPFLRMKVRLKEEIVTIGDASVDPTERVGAYVEPWDWNALIADPEVLVIDTRNDFEVRIGSFQGAVDPHTKTFGDFPAYVRNNLDPGRHRKVAMFCTGGIRCEKATSLMLREGFEEVYHLKGGVLKYLEEIPAEESLWQGACFVFDKRVAVGHGLSVEDYQLCHGCLSPLNAEERRSPEYEEGVSCPYCAPMLTEAQKASSRERQRQVVLAEKRGGVHLGPVGGAAMQDEARASPTKLGEVASRSEVGGVVVR